MTRVWREQVSWFAEPLPMLKVGATLLAVGVASGLLWLGNRRERTYLRFAGEVLANPAESREKRLEVLGHVGCGSIRRRAGTNHYQFKIEDDQIKGSIEARYTGALPDQFASGMDVLVLGRLGADGSFDVVGDGIQMWARCLAGTVNPRRELLPSPQARCPTVSAAD